MQEISSLTPTRGPAKETTEKLSKWKTRWDENMLGWHKNEPHRNLLKYGHQIIPSFNNANANASNDNTCSGSSNGSNNKTTCQSEGFRVFVPLCGKSVDMAFLAQHTSVSQVVGIDGIRKALVSFADENPIFEIQTTTTTDEQQEEQSGSSKGDNIVVVERLTGNGIQLLRGDLFDLNDQVTEGKFDMILDRASIVAIQPILREQYANTMGKLIKPGGSILLSTVDRRSGLETARKAGPPFSVDEQEVKRLYENLDWVEKVTLLEEHDEFQDESMKERFGSQGIESMYELCFIITAKK